MYVWCYHLSDDNSDVIICLDDSIAITFGVISWLDDNTALNIWCYHPFFCVIVFPGIDLGYIRLPQSKIIMYIFIGILLLCEKILNF